MASTQPGVRQLSIEARTLPDSLETLVRYGAGPLPGTVVLDKETLAKMAAAARELLDAVEA